MGELAFRHHQMMHLMVRSLDHDAHESQGLDLCDLARIAVPAVVVADRDEPDPGHPIQRI